MLRKAPGSTVATRLRGSVRVRGTRIPVWLIIAGLGVLLATVSMQVIALRVGVKGPLVRITDDVSGVPGSAETYLAALVIALVGLTPRYRFAAVVSAVALQAVFSVGRWLRSEPFALGDGALYALLGLTIATAVVLRGAEQRRAAKSIAIGLLLAFATKLADTWLAISATARPRVLDEFVVTVDEALGQPSWQVGRALEVLGPIPTAVLHAVYIALPIGAIVVALWQLRAVSRGALRWPRHHIIRTFLAIGILGPFVYLLFPVVGPVFAYGPQGGGWAVVNAWPHTLPVMPAQPGWLEFDAETARNCMPSLHTAWSLTIFLHSRRGPRWLRYGGAFWFGATLLATLGFGYHYGADLISGAVLALTIEAALRDPGRGWDRARVGLVAVGVAMFAGLLFAYRHLAGEIAAHPDISVPLLLGVLVGLSGWFVLQFFADSGSDDDGAVAGRPPGGSPRSPAVSTG
ncbi:MAG: phosphatase PAP2 family protein [Gordonia sp. (in: high G+C Gram-positive bacteria)]